MNASRTNVSRLVTGVDATLIRGNVTRAEINASPLEIAQMQLLLMDGEKNDISQFSPCVQRCLCALAGHMQLGDDGGANYNGRFELTRYASAGYMHLDAAAVRALELFSVNYDDRDNVALSTDASSPQTLFDALNKCRSLPGQRLLRDWLRRPLADARRIAERQDVVRALGVVHTARCTMHEDLLRRVPDLPALARKLVQKKAGLQDCYRMYQAVRLIDRFDSILTDVFNHVDCVDTAPAIRELLLEPLRVCAAQFARFTHLIETTIDVGQGDKTGVFRIRPEVDANLLEVSRRMKAVEKEAKKLLDGIATKMDSDQVSVDHNDQHGYFFRVTFKEEKTVRRLGFTVLDTNKGAGVRFSTKQLDAVNAEHREMQAEYNDAQSSLIRAVLDTCAGYVAPLHQLSTVFAMMDVLVSFAMLANAASSSLTYVQPEILDKNARVLELVQCRHPVLELLPDMHFVPNDVMLGKEAGSGKRFLVITGANMGGKSTLLRATALSVLLGQIGAPVPCTSARFSVVDGIHARVGASDFQFKGMSTFMAEMVESAAILETATENSLVIVDELGRGTSTYDGFGLAYAIAEYLLQRVGCFVLFATHFHEMAALARPESDPEGRVLCVRAETQIAPGTGDVILLFRFREGVAERSFGVQCAQLVGFPQKIIESANRLLDLLSGDCSNNSPSSNKENEDEAMESGDDDSEMRAIEVLKRLRAIPGDQLRRAILM